ncbi:unnamed protein product, partial [Porites lobata]
KVLSNLDLRFSGNDQELLCALGNICHSETLDKESFSRILEAEEKITIIQCVAQIENLPPQHLGQQCVSDISHLLTLKWHMPTL